ncbi:MAG: hypothetical protein HRU50_10415 [Winogradskyella sp.]|uniref:DUF6671 family protein n=1 Tax=Winogradskyella sp. TaxID=1883156 RepID=UPI0025DE2B96|nr:DUF6671 family protein [Winogradskyella sp.]NRB60333.1 hypothetical protein [Winogradskyella sp.]
MDLFKDRRLIIATKHKKEAVIAPILEGKLGVKCFIDPEFDTDELGTFSGEIERKNNPLDTARQKCLKAMESNNCDLGIASEGSFGQHPTLFFASADEELLIFIDKKNKLEIVAKVLSTDTNFNGKEVLSEIELLEFAESAKFPSHGLILKKSKSETSDMIKGITTIEDLKRGFQYLHSKYKSVFVETDMRAMYNPTRMKVIETTTNKIAEKINSICPNCQKPGFGIMDYTKGLPCDLCGSPTNSTLSVTYSCKHCDFSEEKLYPNNKQTEDPMYCNFCNP